MSPGWAICSTDGSRCRSSAQGGLVSGRPEEDAMRRATATTVRVVAAFVAMLLVLIGVPAVGAWATPPSTSSTRCGDEGTPTVIALQDSHFYIDTASTATLYSGYAGYTIKALANKVTSVTAAPSPAFGTIGDAVTLTVTGNTGTLGAGPGNDPGVLDYTPNALADFPANAWRLERTELTISPDGDAPPVTYVDRLFLTGA